MRYEYDTQAPGYDTGAVFLRNNPVEIRTYGQTTHKYRKPDPRGRALDKQQCHRGVGGGQWLFRVLGLSKLSPARARCD